MIILKSDQEGTHKFHSGSDILLDLPVFQKALEPEIIVFRPMEPMNPPSNRFLRLFYRLAMMRWNLL